ncbi:MAG: NADH-quinone oxidoreductase subunit L, partial [Cytophagales bacterium]|nr:NADH-quinone oxidoreductase subunit L [Cytophagales bacterium]
AIFILAMPVYVFLYLWLSPKKYVKSGDWVAIGMIAIGFLMAVYLLAKTWYSPETWFSLPWFEVGKLSFHAGIYIGNIQALMTVLVTFVSLMVHVYSVDYMKGDPNYHRYFAYLNLFTFSMLGIVLSDNLLLLFFFWELVGMSSYLLIGFWQRKEMAGKAAQKAFIVNRIGDLGLLTSICIIFIVFGTLHFPELKTAFSESRIENGFWMVGGNAFPTIFYFVIGFGLLLACMGKSAQFPLQIWLPDAMQGPTPVSALIHAATMVAAGVFLLFQCYSFLAPEVLTIITFIGCLTAFMGAYAASGQADIKKILAYSTVSQLGFMVMAIGVGTPENGIFHLVTHAFFKAALFLAAGSVIHAFQDMMHRMHQEGLRIHFNPQHINIMGGLWKKMPFTAGIYLVATWGAAGLPLSSGFLSKDEILTAILAWGSIQSDLGHWWAWIIPGMAFLTTLLTAFYMTRQFLLIFNGESRLVNYLKVHFSASLDAPGAKEMLDKLTHVHDATTIMQIPMGALAVFTVWFFFSLNPLDASHAWIPNDLKSNMLATLSQEQRTIKQGLDSAVHAFHPIAIALSSGFIIIGFLLANWIYRNRPSTKIQKVKSIFFNPDNLLNKLGVNHFYLDELYRNTAVRYAFSLAKLSQRMDVQVNKLVDFMGIFIAVFGHFIAWIDKNFIDGLALLPAKISGKMGAAVQQSQSLSLQIFIILAFSVLGIVGLITLIF